MMPELYEMEQTLPSGEAPATALAGALKVNETVSGKIEPRKIAEWMLKDNRPARFQLSDAQIHLATARAWRVTV